MNQHAHFRHTALAAAIAAALALPAISHAGVLDGIFELEGNAIDSPAGGPEDWSSVNTEYNKIPGTYAGAAKVRVFVPDFPGLPGVPFTRVQDDPAFGAGCKDINDLTGCTVVTGSIPDKNQITNGYAAFYAYDGPETAVKNPDGSTIPFNGGVLTHRPGDLIVTMGGDLHVENGSASWGGWFTRKPIEINAAGSGFTFGRSVGDILVVAEFHEGQSGPGVTFSVARWVGTGGNVSDTLQELFTGTALRCSTATADALGCAISNNEGPVTAPWPYIHKGDKTAAPYSSDFPATAFAEGILNLSAVLRLNGQGIGCISDFLFESRSSGESYSAKLKDFLVGHVPLCKIGVDKSGDTESKATDPADYSIRISNTGVVPLDRGSITDTLLGDMTNPGNAFVVDTTGRDTTCYDAAKNPLLPGESCDIYATRTVQGTDPDPLPNTVTVVYTQGTGANKDSVSATSDHSVNLFQPSITFGKSANPTLTKAGHDVAYALTLNNTSSADTPDLECTVTDTMLGVNKNVTLATGAQDVTNATYTVKGTDTDPLTNSANVSCSPKGYPNIYTAAAGASVNLFQPSISFTKVGDTRLTKPGHAINYTLTLNNTSSSDTPDLTCQITDSKLGVSESVTLASGGQKVINKSYMVQPGDLPGPVVNNASVSCSPAGFTNTYPGSGSWSVNLFNPSIQVTKACQDAGATDPNDKTVNVGYPLRYTFTLTNTTSGAGAPALMLDSLSDNVLGDLAALAASNGCSSLANSASCSFTKDYTPTAANETGLTNTVIAHYHPQGFSNDITHQASDTCYVMPAPEGCTPGFWQGGAGSKLWNQVNDPHWRNGGGDGTNPYIHTTLFNSFFTAHPGLDGMTMLALVSTGGTEYEPQKAARNVVAAYLNASWGMNFGYGTTAIMGMWNSAVTGTPYEGKVWTFMDIHNALGSANDPTPGDDCPI